jgi:hypothetical protein
MNNEERQLLEEELNMQEEIRMLEEEENQKEQAEIIKEEGEEKDKELKDQNKEDHLSEEKEETEKKKFGNACLMTCKKNWYYIGGAILVAVILFMLVISATVYAKDFRSAYVRSFTEHVPFPAMIIGSEWVSIEQVIEEYDTMQAYIATLEGYPGLPGEEEIITTAIETTRNKVVVAQLAAQYGIELDETKVDEAYLSLSGGSENEEAFLDEMQSVFKMSKEDILSRVVEPLVLAQQVSVGVLENEEVQEARLQFAQSVHQRLVDGEEFAVVAAEVNEAFNSLADGNLGAVKISEIPESWMEVIDSLEAGQYSEVYIDEEVSAYYLFFPGERTGYAEEEEMTLSIIMIPFMQIQEVMEQYVEENVKWEYLDEETIHELVYGEEDDTDSDAHADEENEEEGEDEDSQREEVAAEEQGGLTEVPSEE